MALTILDIELPPMDDLPRYKPWTFSERFIIHPSVAVLVFLPQVAVMTTFAYCHAFPCHSVWRFHGLHPLCEPPVHNPACYHATHLQPTTQLDHPGRADDHRSRLLWARKTVPSSCQELDNMS